MVQNGNLDWIGSFSFHAARVGGIGGHLSVASMAWHITNQEAQFILVQ